MTSTFKTKSFVNDTDRLHSHPYRERVNGVMTSVRIEVPRLQDAEAVYILVVEDRYLMVRVVIHGAPLYVHTVFFPLDSTDHKRFFDQLPTRSFEQTHPTSFVKTSIQLSVQGLTPLVVHIAMNQIVSHVWIGF